MGTIDVVYGAYRELQNDQLSLESQWNHDEENGALLCKTLGALL